ncbi:MAG: hypothetical protein EOO46_17565, partial [Flavobacterium sp.]
MQAIEDIRDIFSILHDGTIETWAGDMEFLTLTVDCMYLAERISKAFEKFYVELYHIDKIQLETWIIPIPITPKIKTGLAEIFQAKLEILSAEIKEDVVAIACNQHDKEFDYHGGTLTIRCHNI